MKKAEKEKFRKLLLDRKEAIQGNVNNLKNDVLSMTSNASGSGGSSMPTHMADLGSDNYDQDLALGLIENEEKELRKIRDALRRLDNGTFGVCEACQARIPKARLEAIPYARLCIRCKELEERGELHNEDR